MDTVAGPGAGAAGGEEVQGRRRGLAAKPAAHLTPEGVDELRPVAVAPRRHHLQLVAEDRHGPLLERRLGDHDTVAF